MRDSIARKFMLRDTAFVARNAACYARPLRATGESSMAKRINEEHFAAILAVVASKPGGISRQDIAEALPHKLPPRTLQFRLRNLVRAGRPMSVGVGRALRYLPPGGAGRVRPHTGGLGGSGASGDDFSRCSCDRALSAPTARGAKAG